MNLSAIFSNRAERSFCCGARKQGGAAGMNANENAR